MRNRSLLHSWSDHGSGRALFLVAMTIWCAQMSPARASPQDPQRPLEISAATIDAPVDVQAGEPARSWLFGIDSGWSDSSSTLYRIDPNARAAQVRGETYIDEVTDLAFCPDGTLYAVTFSKLLKLNPRNGARTVLGDLGSWGVNALACSRAGILYYATSFGDFGTINKFTGDANEIGSLGDGLRSSGDLAFDSNGKLYGSASRLFSSSNSLIAINAVTGAATEIGDMGQTEVYGLAFSPTNRLFGVARGNTLGSPDLITVSLSSGAATIAGAVFGVSNGMYGLASIVKNSPVSGSLRVTGTDNLSCENAANVWTLCQHRSGFHRPGGGIQGSDDTFAWDTNLSADADAGKPVHPVAAGKVVKYAGVSAPGGCSGAVLIEHSAGGKWWSGYLHMSGISVQVGQTVTSNTVIGYVAKASCASPVPNHLHLVLYQGSNEPGKLVSFNASFYKR